MKVLVGRAEIRPSSFDRHPRHHLDVGRLLGERAQPSTHDGMVIHECDPDGRRSTVAPMGGRYLIGVSAANRQAAGVACGETHDIELELDVAPRTVELPDDFAAALGKDPGAKRTFDALSPSNKGWHVSSIEGAKSAETRQRRIQKQVAALSEGRPR